MALQTIICKKNLLRNNPTVLSFGNVRGLRTFSLPDLPYGYGALEPIISGDIMELHHQKHHNTYVTNFNKALEQLEEAMDKGDSLTVVKLQRAFKFNGGGGGDPPRGLLGHDIQMQFFSLEKLIRTMNAEGAALQGSGWVWLAHDTEFKRLRVETTVNQYKNAKADYLKNIWRVMNWNHANEVYESVGL